MRYVNIEIGEYLSMKKAIVFVEHIDKHLKDEPDEFEPDAKVICTLCNKTIDQIYSEFKENEDNG